MGQTDINNADATLNESVAKVNTLVDTINDSVAKLNDSTNKFYQSSARMERLLLERHSSFGTLFWMLMLLVATIAILYFIPNSNVKPYLDRSGEKLGQIGSRVAGKLSGEVSCTQNASKPANIAASTTVPLSANPAPPKVEASDAKVDQTTAPKLEQDKTPKLASPSIPVHVTVTDAAPSSSQPKATEKTVTATTNQPATKANTAAPVNANASGSTAPTTPIKKPSDAVASTNNPTTAARMAVQAHQYGLATKMYETYLESNPNDSDAWGELGNVQLALGHPYEAAQYYFEASTRQLDQGHTEAVYPLLPIIAQYQPRLAAILHQKMTMQGL
jgi:hypothetical protein